MGKSFLFCSRCRTEPGEKCTCVGVYSAHNFIEGNKDAYCSRCGTRPGKKSSCVGVYSDHNFISGTGDVYCSRCGTVPGEKCSCVGVYSDHNFISGYTEAFCNRCGTKPGKKSSCVGVYSDHNFIAAKKNSPVKQETELLKESKQDACNESPLHQQGYKAEKNNDLPIPIKQQTKQDILGTSILFLAADPSDASRLRLGEEFREIQEKLKQSKLRDRFQLALPQLSTRPADISQAMLDAEPKIVHFSGHGTSSGALCFENIQGKTQLVQPEALAALFEHFSPQVNCVLLNACYSQKQAEAIAEHIPYVIGMNRAIGDKAAIAFAVGFYQALGASRSIKEAYDLGCGENLWGQACNIGEPMGGGTYGVRLAILILV